MVGYRLEVPSLFSKPKPSEFPVVSGDIIEVKISDYDTFRSQENFYQGGILGHSSSTAKVTGILRWNCFNDSSFTGG